MPSRLPHLQFVWNPALASALLVCDFEPFLKQRPASAMPHQLSGIIPKLLPAAENMYGFHRL
jgi:hypothetical protein